MQDVPNTSTTTLRRIIELAEARGLDFASLLDHAGIKPFHLDSVWRIPLPTTYAALESASVLLDDAAFGLELALEADPDAFDLVTCLCMTGATLHDALDSMLRYQRIWGDGEHVDLVLDGDEAALVVHHWGPQRPAHRLIAQCHLVDFHRAPTTLVGTAWHPLRLEFIEIDRSIADRIETVVGCPVVVGSNTAFVFDRTTLATPMPMAGSVLHAELTRQADVWLKNLPPRSDLITQVTVVLTRNLGTEPVDLERVARSLGRSPRAIQRGLARAGESFGALLREVRQARAEALLERHTPITEIAQLLGYSETSAFSRAFRRWTGRSPTRSRDSNK